MSFELNAVFSLSIGIGAIIGWIRFSKTDPAYFPFLLLLSIGFINEIISIILLTNGYNNIINFNTFLLIESILLTWQFRKWGLLKRNGYVFYILIFIFAGSWIAENFFISVDAFNSYFFIVQSFLLVIMSIYMINVILTEDSTPLSRQPVFLICLGLIVYFTYAVLVEAFWIFGLNKSRSFRLRVFEIMSYINLVTNLIFAFAFLWIPMRPQYILRS